MRLAVAEADVAVRIAVDAKAERLVEDLLRLGRTSGRIAGR
jgi:hypothetical protein